MNTPLLISTDGSKGSRRSGGSWIIALHNGTHITSGYNPNFGQIRQINSYRAEIYASLSASLFLYHYANYFMIEIGNEFIAICDNLAFVNKLSWLLEDDYNDHGLHKSTEQEASHLILKILPKTFSIEHVKGHQDDYRQYRDLPIKARLNIDADEIATSSSSIPLNHHIQSTKFIIYVNNEYAHHRIDHQIRIHSHAKQAKEFLCEKYSWNSSIFHAIDWQNHSLCLSKLSTAKRRTALRFIHHRLPTGKMQFSFKHACPYCTCLFTSSTKHDHFLICEASQEIKMKRLTSIEKAMNKLHTPPKLRNLILAQLKCFYHNTPTTKFSPEQIERCEITKSIALQQHIGWQHFIRGRLPLSYIPIINKYYRSNKLGQKYTANRWMKGVTLMLLNLHTDDWRNYCSIIHSPVPNVKHSTPALSTLLTLVAKYYSLSKTLPHTKKNGFLVASFNSIRGTSMNYRNGLEQQKGLSIRIN